MSAFSPPLHYIAVFAGLFLTSAVCNIQRLYGWWTKKSPRDVLSETIAEARLFEEWEASAYQLDEVLRYDLWYVYRLACAFDFSIRDTES